MRTPSELIEYFNGWIAEGKWPTVTNEDLEQAVSIIEGLQKRVAALSRAPEQKAAQAEVELLQMKATAFDECIDKTNWVQEQISTFPITALGKHRADIMRDEIERLRATSLSRAPEQKSDSEPAVHQPHEWEYCPECGCTESEEPRNGMGHFCTKCGQEWHSHIDYSDVVRTKLAHLSANRQAPSASPAVQPTGDWNAAVDAVAEKLSKQHAWISNVAAATVALSLKRQPSEVSEQKAAQAGVVAWVRFRSDGGYEGPIMDCDRRMDGRRESGAWTPLYAALPPAQEKTEDAKDAERYRFLRDPKSDVALVIDKRTEWVPPDDAVPGVGGYWMYEYRAGDELDSAIDAAIASQAKEGE